MVAAISSLTFELGMTCKPSTSHLMVSPVQWTLPSKTYVTWSPNLHPIEVTSPSGAASGWVPMFIMIDEPVP